MGNRDWRFRASLRGSNDLTRGHGAVRKPRNAVVGVCQRLSRCQPGVSDSVVPEGPNDLFLVGDGTQSAFWQDIGRGNHGRLLATNESDASVAREQRDGACTSPRARLLTMYTSRST